MNIYKVLETFSRWCPNSIRQLAWLLGKPYETTRRFIKRLSSEEAKETHAKRVIEMWAKDKELLIVAIDPTYTKGRA